jgi:hypothetical protein
MFGRDLEEQIRADGQHVPTIVLKCIEAVEGQGGQLVVNSSLCFT